MDASAGRGVVRAGQIEIGERCAGAAAPRCSGSSGAGVDVLRERKVVSAIAAAVARLETEVAALGALHSGGRLRRLSGRAPRRAARRRRWPGTAAECRRAADRRRRGADRRSESDRSREARRADGRSPPAIGCARGMSRWLPAAAGGRQRRATLDRASLGDAAPKNGNSRRVREREAPQRRPRTRRPRPRSAGAPRQRHARGADAAPAPLFATRGCDDWLGVRDARGAAALSGRHRADRSDRASPARRRATRRGRARRQRGGERRATSPCWNAAMP